MSNSVFLKITNKMWALDSRENNETCFHQMSDFKAKMHQNRYRLGLILRPCWEAYSAPQVH